MNDQIKKSQDAYITQAEEVLAEYERNALPLGMPSVLRSVLTQTVALGLLRASRDAVTEYHQAVTAAIKGRDPKDGAA